MGDNDLTQGSGMEEGATQGLPSPQGQEGGGHTGLLSPEQAPVNEGRTQGGITETLSLGEQSPGIHDTTTLAR